MRKRYDIILPDDIDIYESESGSVLLINYPKDKYSENFIESIANEFLNNNPEILTVIYESKGESK